MSNTLIRKAQAGVPSGGTTSQVLKKSSNTDYDYDWGTGAASPLTTKGDLYTFSTLDARLGVGANLTSLVADSAQATGLRWNASTGTGNSVFSISPTLTTSLLTGSATFSLLPANATTVAAFGAATTVSIANGPLGSQTFNIGTVAAFGSAGALTMLIGTSATPNGAVKSIELGTEGLAGSTTNITLGSANTGMNLTLNIAGGSDANGDMWYRAGGVVARLGKGTAFQVIRMNAGATAPEWATNSPTLTVGTTGITSGTAGRILFEDASNILNEDALLNWQNTDKVMGVGVAVTTTTRLSVKGLGTTSGTNSFTAYNSSGSAYGLAVRDDNITIFSTAGGTCFVSPSLGFYGYKFNSVNGSSMIDMDGGKLNLYDGAGVLMANFTSAGLARIGSKLYLGDVTTTATAVLHLAAGTATANTGPFKFTLPGVPVTTREAGLMETEAEKLLYTPTSLARQALPGVIFTQTADKTVTNTTSETSIVGTGVGSLATAMTLPANFFVAGKTVRLRIGGIYSTPIASTPSVLVKIKYGSTVIATVTTTGLLAGASGLEFDGEVAITCRTTGASGSVMVHGDIEYATGLAGTISVDPLNNAGTATTIDTTAASLLDVTIIWDTATSTRIVKSTVCLVEVLN